MTTTSEDRSDGSHRDDGITRRGALRSLVAVGAMATSGCVAALPSGGRATSRPGDVAEPTFARVERNDAYGLTYRWRHASRDWAVDLEVPTARYREAVEAARSVPRSFEVATTSPLTRAVAASLARQLEGADVDSPLARLAAATSFVRSMEYVRDRRSTGRAEYPRYAAETLVENRGDCEDLAVVLAGVLAAPPFDLEPALVFFAGHVGVGVDPTRFDVGPDVLLRAGSREYVYVDASFDVRLGTVPAEYRDPGVVAVYDGRWRHVDLRALGDHAESATREGGLRYLPSYL